MNLITQRPASPANYEQGRRGNAIRFLVVHVEEGSERGTAETFAEAGHASAHYGIGRDGAIDQFVADADTAWHAGNADVNRGSIGIELEGFTATLALTGEQFAALVDLCSSLCAAHSIQPDRTTIFGHDEVPDPRDPTMKGGRNHHTDPGPLFPWDRLMSALAPVA